MTAARRDRPRLTAIACASLLVIVAVGSVLRLHGLERLGITHAEIYVPHIAMPAWVDAPPPRRTFAETIFGTLHHDNHPPGYYAFMWVWTGLAGTGLWALRLPGALAGAATLALLYWMARRRDGEAAALTATALLALHGHHIFWSQQARMWVFLGLLGVWSVVLLQSLHARPRLAPAAAYVGVVCAGLWSEYSFWPFFFAQVVWELLRNAEARALPATSRLQLLALVLASPVPAFLAVHLGLERTGYLAQTGALEHLGGFLLLQWLLPPPEPPATLDALASGAVLALLFAGTALLFAGVARSPACEPPRPWAGAAPARWRGLGIAAALVASLCGLGLYRGSGEAAFAVSAGVPWLLLIAQGVASRGWPVLAGWLRALRGDGLRRRIAEDAATAHTAVPLLLLLLASLWTPSLAPRSLLFLTPFALVLVARGVFAVARRPAWRAVWLATLLGVCTASAGQYTRWGTSPSDYRTLAEAMGPQLRPADVILINDDWQAQPMHYYFPPDRYRTGDFGPHLAGLTAGPRAQPERVWVLLLSERDVGAFAVLAPHLRRHREARRVTTANATAVLFERRTASP